MPLPLRVPLPDAAVPAIHDGAQFCPEDFLWVAVYDDGDWLAEVDPDGTAHGFADIDQARLATFVLLPLRDHLAPVALEPSRDGKRLIFFRRRVNTYEGGGGTLVDAHSLTVVGWQDTVGGHNVQALHVIHPDGSVYLAPDSSHIH